MFEAREVRIERGVMADAKTLWRVWQSWLGSYQPDFTLGGWGRFVQRVSGMVLCDEEHTITQIVMSIGLEDRSRGVRGGPCRTRHGCTSAKARCPWASP